MQPEPPPDAFRVRPPAQPGEWALPDTPRPVSVPAPEPEPVQQPYPWGPQAPPPGPRPMPRWAKVVLGCSVVYYGVGILGVVVAVIVFLVTH